MSDSGVQAASQTGCGIESRTNGRQRWSDYEDEMIREHYPTHGAQWSGWDRLCDRSSSAIQGRARRLGVSYLGKYTRPTLTSEEVQEMADMAVMALDEHDRTRLVAAFGRAFGRKATIA